VPGNFVDIVVGIVGIEVCSGGAFAVDIVDGKAEGGVRCARGLEYTMAGYSGLKYVNEYVLD